MVTYEVDPATRITRYEYDDMGRLVKAKGERVVSRALVRGAH